MATALGDLVLLLPFTDHPVTIASVVEPPLVTANSFEFAERLELHPVGVDMNAIGKSHVTLPRAKAPTAVLVVSVDGVLDTLHI